MTHDECIALIHKYYQPHTDITQEENEEMQDHLNSCEDCLREDERQYRLETEMIKAGNENIRANVAERDKRLHQNALSDEGVEALVKN